MILYPFIAVGMAVCLLVAFVPRGAWTLHLIPVAGFLILLWLIGRVRRLGIEIVGDGVIAYGTFWSRRIKWDEIDDLELFRWGINQEIKLRLTDGNIVRTNLLQGRVVSWPGGKTKDIFTLLQTELKGSALL
jgi:hypothetical protein